MKSTEALEAMEELEILALENVRVHEGQDWTPLPSPTTDRLIDEGMVERVGPERLRLTSSGLEML